MIAQRAELREAARRLRKIVVLSPREREVLSHAAHGDPDDEIAGYMFVTRRTVRHYFTVLFQKLDVRNRVDVATTGLLAHVATCEECLRIVEAFRTLTPAGEPIQSGSRTQGVMASRAPLPVAAAGTGRVQP